eukprot:309185-Alexandrium_andersonii.AAC.1
MALWGTRMRPTQGGGSETARAKEKIRHHRSKPPNGRAAAEREASAEQGRLGWEPWSRPTQLGGANRPR